MTGLGNIHVITSTSPTVEPVTVEPVASSRRGSMVHFSLLALVSCFVVFGLWQFGGYVLNYSRYRGFGPPVSTVPVSQRGTLHDLSVPSVALGEKLHATVYLPAGYDAHPGMHYPVLYLLHGTPGNPNIFANALHMYAHMDTLVAGHLVRPFIIVAPRGSNSTYDHATEWANGPGPHQRWFTAVTHDLVPAVDHRYRTLARAHDRGVAGMSSGADAALNAVILAPRIFGLAEGWSGDYAQTPGTVGNVASIVSRFSATVTATQYAPRLARRGVRVFMYAGRHDKIAGATLKVAGDLRAGGVHVDLQMLSGGHSWVLWDRQAVPSLVWFGRSAR